MQIDYSKVTAKFLSALDKPTKNEDNRGNRGIDGNATERRYKTIAEGYSIKTYRLRVVFWSKNPEIYIIQREVSYA